MTAALTFLKTVYDALKAAINAILAETIFKASPEIAEYYADGVGLLVTLSALYLILEVVSAGKRIIRLILILGWALLLISIGITAMGQG
jgi:hypothetical protein